ncbi:hypothetical protein ACFPYI_05220 [Halomarina salina]|uniref:Uncharacterized protein n=1 Tax=Halomarina salina TaxID=1872699 RepID=A0ABD5RKJ9_9EURY|nr:hypothetical protein [Halomarina salina]
MAFSAGVLQAVFPLDPVATIFAALTASILTLVGSNWFTERRRTRTQQEDREKLRTALLGELSTGFNRVTTVYDSHLEAIGSLSAEEIAHLVSYYTSTKSYFNLKSFLYEVRLEFEDAPDGGKKAFLAKKLDNNRSRLTYLHDTSHDSQRRAIAALLQNVSSDYFRYTMLRQEQRERQSNPRRRDIPDEQYLLGGTVFIDASRIVMLGEGYQTDEGSAGDSTSIPLGTEDDAHTGFSSEDDGTGGSRFEEYGYDSEPDP